MLGVSNEQRLMDRLWEKADEKFELPPEIADRYFEYSGPTPVHVDNRRAFHRYYLRTKTVIEKEGLTLGIYTTDISRQGIGFLCSRQLLPKERFQLVLPNGTTCQLEIARCRRTKHNYYECGGRFALANFQDAHLSEGQL